MNKSQHEPVAPADLDAAALELQRELALVDQELVSALEDLPHPFRQLVQSQLKRSYPLLRAGIVLAAGVGAPDSPQLRVQRIHLAAALEMLQLALGIHVRLLSNGDGVRQAIDQSVMGSTILAGDFCFSRAAGLAVKTNSPVVVDVFAQALQHLSEGRLRRLFSAEAIFDEDSELFRSGILGAMALTGGAPELQSALLEIGEQLAVMRRQPAQVDYSLPNLTLPDRGPAQLSAQQAMRWQALYAWMQR